MTDQELIRGLRCCVSSPMMRGKIARRRRKREKDTHMQAVRVHEADRKSANYWQQPSGRVRTMGEHKHNSNCQLAKEGNLPPKIKPMGKRETERYIQSLIFAKMAKTLTKKGGLK